MGNANDAVRWSHEARCYVWDCIYGCWGFDYESEIEACKAFLDHRCVVG